MAKGFTLLEVFIAVFIAAVAIVGVFSLVNQISTFAPNTVLQLAASSLAQEGVEIVRNIRDTNFLKVHVGVPNTKWDDDLRGCTSQTAGCEADSTSTALTLQDRFLNLSNGFYSYSAGTQTSFKRKIFVDPNGTDIRNVTVQVSWQERGRTHMVSGAAVLYNWLTPTP